ncbi:MULTISPECIES: HlyD family efflux transporter periplasmic adaptor subunit [unclassified Tatumella]|uniref:HlyD family efflux transporter periplasmic adaptor subunit n=1 Tax=unclassified Tatumella TaxID=2649542 RepID=UPI0032C3D91B
MQSLNTQLIQEGLQVISLETEIATQSADFDNKAAEYALKRSELQRELAEVNASGTLIITAPEEGNIENMVYTAGQMVAAGDSLAQLMPGGRPQFLLVLWLPDSSVPYVSPGDAVNLRYDAYPFQKFGQFPGRIKSVSRIPASAKELMMYSSIAPAVNNGAGQAYYKTIIELAADSFRFRGESMNWSNGMKAQATLFLERRPLYQWILSPYYDIRRSLGGPV